MENFSQLINRQKDYFNKGYTRDVEFRKEQLKKLKILIRKNEDKIMEALNRDLGKAKFESYFTEIGFVLEELNHIIKNLHSWARRQKIKTPLTHFPARSYIYREPYGSVLIISPWNYPFQLTLGPLMGALAAGNCAVVMPSGQATYTSDIIKKMICENFSSNYVTVIEGGKEVKQRFLKENIDYIFFTGSTEAGKQVLKTAANNLIPVTLELGGKSPCIIARDSNIELAARRICWGKFINAGQTCVAPDYLLVHKEIKEELIEAIITTIINFFGEYPEKSADYPRIVNKKHINRLKSLMAEGEIVMGGEVNEEEKYIAPTVIDNISWADPIMQEEIFGPLLPVIEYESLENEILRLKDMPKPLALYLFTDNEEVKKKIVNEISFGGGCINDTIMHLASLYLPFGGVGQSGMGAYHGKESFETFSHKKSIVKKYNFLDVNLRYPPYKNKLKKLNGIVKKIMGLN